MANTFENIETTASDMLIAREQMRQIINSKTAEYHTTLDGETVVRYGFTYLPSDAPLSYFSRSIDTLKSYSNIFDWSLIGIYDDIEMMWEGISYGAEIKTILENTINAQSGNTYSINSIFGLDVATTEYDFPLRYGYSSYDFIFTPNTEAWEKVTTASEAFKYCPKNSYIGFLNLKNVTSCSYMFGENWALRNIDTVYAPLSSMHLAFVNCTMLTEINNITTGGGEMSPYTFSFCNNLVRINNYDFRNITSAPDSGLSGALNLRYLAIDGLGTRANCTSFNFSKLSYWGVNTTYITDAFDSLVYTFNNALNRQDYGYSRISVQLSDNTYSLLENNTDITISGINNNTGGDLISQISQKGISIGH